MAAMAVAPAAASASHGEGTGVTEITCNRVTWKYSDFPNAANNRVQEFIKVNQVTTSSEWVFNGPESEHTTYFESPEGTFKVDAHARWDTNGVTGNFDHMLQGKCEPSLKLEKEQRLAGSEEWTKYKLKAAAGETVEYRIKVTNTGNRNLTLGELNDPNCEQEPPNGNEIKPFAQGRTLNVEESTYFECTRVLEKAGFYYNAAEITGTTEDGKEVTGKSNEVELEVPDLAELSIVKTGPPTAIAGEEIAYQLTVHNAGPAGAENTVVTDELSPDVKFVKASEGCTYAEPELTCNAGELQVGESKTYEVTVKVNPEFVGTIPNTGRATTSTPEKEPKTNESTVETVVESKVHLNITKTGPKEAATGEAITWTIVGSNEGPSTATEVRIVDPIPSNATYVSASTTKGSCEYVAPKVICPLGNLAPGEKVEVTIHATSKALPRETITNTAVIQSKQEERQATFQTGNKPSEPSDKTGKKPLVTLKKTGSPAKIEEGQKATFHIHVFNSGPVAALKVKTCDQLPAHTILVNAGHGRVSGRTVCWTLAKLASHAGRTYTIVLRSTLKFQGKLVNHATTVGSNFAEKRASASVTVVRRGAIQGKVTG